ncbi:MAG: uracil-DNA glycosylase [Sedimentisphaerales bacterium]|nr:uracil-DNA glycosylase [Sedimentisphaerales bacterium]
MPERIDAERLKDSLLGQLESERFLGGRWLPMGIGAKKEAETIKNKQQRLEEIAQLVSQCRKCDLAQTRIKVVPGQGNPHARLVFVGEAPGASEDEQGLPFVGRAGKLLDDIINAMGLSREEVFIGNILKCRPPDNRDPQKEEIMNCEGFLHEQLRVIEPEIIVALGAHAARTLLQVTTPIGQLRGRFYEYVPGEGAEPIKLLATYHPAYLLRNYSQDNRRRVWDDMKKVLRELGLEVPGKK